MHDLISRKWLMECIDEGWIKFETEKDKNLFIHLVRDIAPSAQPYTDEEIQKMQDIEQAQLDKAYEMGKADALRWIPCSDVLQWIPCSEGLPEYGEAVLTINEDEDYEVNHIIDEDNGEWFYEGAIMWMPLPESPKER